MNNRRELTETQIDTFVAINKGGLISPEMVKAFNHALVCKPIPHDVLRILNDEQYELLAKDRYTTCETLLKELDKFYSANYRHLSKKLGWRYWDDNPIGHAAVVMGHDGNRTLTYVKIVMAEGKYRLALVHINDWPRQLSEYYNLFTGKSDYDVRPFLPQLFPEVAIDIRTDHTRAIQSTHTEGSDE